MTEKDDSMHDTTSSAAGAASPSPTRTSCAVLHTDDRGNTVPCPGYPHVDGTETAPEQEKEERAARVAAAYALIEEDRNQRMAACLADIEAVLDKHGMTLDTIPARVVLTPRDQT